ncbi:ATP-binding protein [Burkholderia vietnamiensis]|uniref:ATP-binding protein n=1 Tax=Burkholderia vietnamiensis TaxID=60552 RepID=A0AAW7T4W0_BURVI|nr:ATP-binding protein [Burkholderia vietnamiensis]MDN7797237.1 ATP-binding protein [Burkholderia vietnamiensis]HDR9192532.1 ATP-binding protein [Burkholderia vietnamiensis]
MTKPSTDQAQASPTKQFFVSMLTRDISLADAILDLLDNCLDGAMRLANGVDVDYAKHFVKIEIAGDHFSITDNCGGIPRDIAKNYAFKMGREPDDDRDSDAETIGMYGVGMKRAIFKMGRNALVRTRYGDDTFEVPITSQWLDAKNWDPLPINEPTEASEQLDEPGTTIYVGDLYDGVSRHFANGAFENEVRTAIAEHFTMFIQWGLKVELNGTPVESVRVEVLVSMDEKRAAPYIYQKMIDGVLVSITVGLNTGKSLGDDDEDDAGFERDRSSATAGWTVLCNDRAVIVGDKSRLTGWGDGIPLYHPQFAIITGIIEFRSKHADKLPVTTTKRALDTSSNVWLESLVKMKEGMRIWISYTNQWKNHPRTDQSSHWESAKPMPLSRAIEVVAARSATRKIADAIEFNPQKAKVLPEPEDKKPSSRKIVFSRPAEEVRLVSKMLFDDPDEKPGVVGDKCFEMQLTKAKRQGD